ncbi:glycerophosphodiester phosphodiesterase GDPD3 isoform X1 [Capsella rubella]|uniref:glycerophosphodiester phosphodiesterase GDPD3 isoform X1 n=1 Tax=Capsella rubella TaxID=81985 RepID=UPI000CD541C2|nr:glycerophosphodiester phosphodiesterase GDPD3 isoform X1 [Capsella rubella]
MALETMALSTSSTMFSSGVVEDDDKKKQEAFVFPKFVLMGHRGFGMNMLQSPDEKMKFIKENSLLSFNVAADFPIDFIEFDVQVTRDGCPVIFHDIFMFTQEEGVIIENRVTEMALHEFLSYGPQKDGTNVKPMFRKTKDGRIFEWKVEKDDPLCTLEDALVKVKQSVGFNIELKFDDNIVYGEKELCLTLDNILKVVNDHAKNRPIIFSSFHPDVARLIRNMQMIYPKFYYVQVFFLTNGGSEIYKDVRRNSLDEAIKLCKDSGLQGIVSEVKAILRTPNAITRIKDSNLSLLSYGQLNNVVEVVYLQHHMGVEGVIVDIIEDISKAITNIKVRNEEDWEDNGSKSLIMFGEEKKKVKVSMDEINFLTKFVPNNMVHNCWT